MKPFFRISLFAALSVLAFACEPQMAIQSNWQKHKPVPGTIYNLAEDSAHLQGAQNILYTVSNDSNNLYVRIGISDRKTQLQVLRFGLTLWLDTTGHKKQKQGIVYPLSAKNNIGTPGLKEQNENLIRTGSQNITEHDKQAAIEFKKKMIMNMIEMDIIGFTEGEPVRIPASGTAGLWVSLQADSFGTLQYQAIIPFALMKYHPPLHTGKKAKPLTLCISVGKPEEAGGKYGGEGAHGGSFSPGGGMGGGGGMSGGGGMGGNGGGMHGGGSQGAALTETIDLWVAVKLAGY